jgi:peptidoglycan-associated lipoprotein
MFNRIFGMVVLAICLGLLLGGCPKKTVVRDDPSLRKAEEMAAAERERAAKLQDERKEREAKGLARIKEEEAKRALVEKELEAERESADRLEAKRAVRERELKWKEEEAKRTLAEKELEAERESADRLEAERALRERELKWKEEEARRARAEKEMEFEKTLVAKKYPGIEGEVFESTQLQDVYFDYDKHDIRPRDIEILQQTAALLMRHPNVKIQIEGHCDERGSQEFNLALGERRANSVKQYLISLGIAHDRISTISYGEEKPVDPGHTEEAYAKNRRGHFVILSR